MATKAKGGSNDFLKRNWVLITVIVTASILVGLGVKYGWFMKPKLKKVPEDVAPPDGSTVTISSAIAHNKAVDLHDTFEGQYLFLDRDTAIGVMTPIYQMNDADIRNIGNKYNELYSGEKRSMKQLLIGEWLGWTAAGALRDKLVKKLTELGF